MGTDDLHPAQNMLLGYVEQHHCVSAREALDWLVGRKVGEEVASAALWDLIDTRSLQLTTDRCLVLGSSAPQARRQLVPA